MSTEAQRFDSRAAYARLYPEDDEQPQYYQRRMRRSKADGGTALVAFLALAALLVLGFIGFVLWPVVTGQRLV